MCFVANKKKGVCFLSFSLAFLTFLSFNSSSSIDFRIAGTKMDSHANNFGIVIDAGSTGSRLFLYEWTSRSDKELIDVRTVFDEQGKAVVKKVTPGLSTFANKPEAAPDYIMPLLVFASEHIPEGRHKETPIFIFATAGMRLLPIDEQTGIIASLREKLPELTELKVVPENIKVISGKWEGIYSWIAVNYMLGRFNLSNLPPDIGTTSGATGQWTEAERPKTAGMIDMGGASAQLAFELPVEGGSMEGSEERNFGDNVELVNLGSRDEERRFLYRVFVTTFLGFGVNEGAKKYEKFLWDRLAKDGEAGKGKEEGRGKSSSALPAVSDGCLPVNFLKLTSPEDEEAEGTDGLQFVRKGSGDWDQCVRDIAAIIFSDHPGCPLTKSCFFGGVPVPRGLSLSQVELYGFSEYWFSVDDVLSLGGLYDHDQFEAKAKEFCGQTWKAIKGRVRAKQYPKADEDRLESQCFKSAWIHAILHNGFYVDDRRNHFQSAFRINGQEVQWALGAIIYQQRHFPLLMNREGEEEPKPMPSEEGASVEQRLHASGTPGGWLAFYFLSILALLALLWRIWRARGLSRMQTNGGGGGRKSFKYRRLDREPSDPPV